MAAEVELSEVDAEFNEEVGFWVAVLLRGLGFMVACTVYVFVLGAELDDELEVGLLLLLGGLVFLRIPFFFSSRNVTLLGGSMRLRSPLGASSQ